MPVAGLSEGLRPDTGPSPCRPATSSKESLPTQVIANRRRLGSGVPRPYSNCTLRPSSLTQSDNAQPSSEPLHRS